MGQLSQENRLVAISDFSLGQDTFLVKSLRGTERISGLYDFTVEVISENLSIDPDQVMGKLGVVTLQDDYQREFSGHVARFTVGEVNESNLRRYTLSLQPWLAFMEHRSGHRIFQDKNTKEILEQLFSELGLQDYEFRAEGGAKREYCVQHRESDLDFVQRLLEEDGIAYYFEHSSGKHKLILVDQPNAYLSLPDSDLEYSRGSAPHAQITHWQHGYRYKTGAVSLTDYDYEDPDRSLLSSAQSQSAFARNAQFEHYQSPGYYHPDLNGELPRIRMEAQELDRNTVSGRSACSQFVAGGKFTLAKHESDVEEGSYILLEVTHEVVDDTQTTGSGGGESYRNRFVCVPADVVIRPAPMHKRPVMPGPQTAVVVGPEGEEIYMDELGRIKVQFHWDREGQRDENSSCFLRVAQSWAGNQWGASFIPRIGHEVVVDFLDGDPDRPLVVGSVYNGKNKPVYSSKTQSGIKTRSTKNAGPDNYNELRFEDKKDAEQILLHAERDYDVEVEHNQTLTVDNDRTKTVRNDERSLIENDRDKTVSNNQSETIGKNKSISVGEDHSEDIGANKQLSVGKDHTESIGQNMTLSIKGNLVESVDENYRETVKKNYDLKAKMIHLQADDEIVLQTGGASIQLKSNGDITISGKNINIKGSGNVVTKGSKVTSN